MAGGVVRPENPKIDRLETLLVKLPSMTAGELSRVTKEVAAV